MYKVEYFQFVELYETFSCFAFFYCFNKDIETPLLVTENFIAVLKRKNIFI